MSNANPPRMQDPPGDADNMPPDTIEVMQANTNEVEELRLTNQRMIGELEQLTRQIQRPRDTRQAQEDHNFPPHEGQHVSNSALGLLYGHGILTIYENLLL